MTDSSRRYPEQRRADPPPARRERGGSAAPAEDTFAGLYRAPADSAGGDGPVRRLPDEYADDARPGGHRRGGDGGMPGRARGWGRLAGRYGVLIVMAGAAAGAFGTIVAGTEPGTVLGVALVTGALAGAFVVRPRAAYRLVPVPAIAGITAALLAGAVHDRAVDTSHTVLALNALEWMSGGFASMAVATLATVLVAVARHIWYNRSQRVSDDSDWDGPGSQFR